MMCITQVSLYLHLSIHRSGDKNEKGILGNRLAISQGRLNFTMLFQCTPTHSAVNCGIEMTLGLQSLCQWMGTSGSF